MADETDPFAGVKEEDPFAQVAVEAPKEVRSAPLTEWERYIFQNVFDTQPARRAEFARQIGFELDPEDDNKLRPLGSQGAFDAEIDPGIGAYFKKDGLAELRKDFGDAALDLAIFGPIMGAATTAAAKGGAAVGAAVGTPAGGVGAAPGAGIGAIIGGAAGASAGAITSYLVTDEMKNAIGTVVLDENIPVDRKAQAAQAFVAGVIPVLGQAGKSGFKALKQFNLERRAKAVVSAIQKSGGVADEALIQKAAANPELFTKEAVQGGGQKLLDLYKNYFGLDPDDFANRVRSFDNIPTDSVFGQQIRPLREAAEKEVQSLATNKAANISSTTLLGTIESQIDGIARLPGKKAQEASALKTLREFRGEIMDYLNKRGVKGSQLNYGESRRLLSVLQDKAFEVDPTGRSVSQNPLIGKLAGQFRESLDQVAANAGSSLPDLNKQQHHILTRFQQASKQLTPDNIFNAYVGGNRTKALEIQNFMKTVDSELGTQFGDAFEEAAAKKYFEGVYKQGIAKGSSRVMPFMVAEGARGALQGASAGAGVGALTGVGVLPGAAIGAVGGGLKGARDAAIMAAPETALGALGKTQAAQAALSAQSPLLTPVEIAAQTALTRPGVSLPAPSKDEEEDPFAGIE